MAPAPPPSPTRRSWFAMAASPKWDRRRRCRSRPARAERGGAIAEAHKRGIKVTGHLCSVSFQEAVALGIDTLEHGMLTASDFALAKQPDLCPVTLLGQLNQADPRGEVAQATIRTMVRHQVSMTSTLAEYEPFVANRSEERRVGK